MVATERSCPCGVGASYADHCERLHLGTAGLGMTAEDLMRARYCAYVLHDESFLLESWHPETRPPRVAFDPSLRWLGLEVVDVIGGAALDAHGMVEFKARFVRGGENLVLHERSSFSRVDGHWRYVTGE